MKTGYTDITVILDRSGSMVFVKKDTIGGFNQFLEDQKKAPGEATITLVQFDHEHEVVYLRQPIADAPALSDETYRPRGNTALLDAIGRTVNTLGETYASMDESNRPENVVLVIQTDGQENASKEFSPAAIKEMIERQTKEYAWEVVYLGANQDAFAVGASIGILRSHSMTYAGDSKGTADALLAVSANLCAYRSGNMASMAYQDADHAKQAR